MAIPTLDKAVYTTHIYIYIYVYIYIYIIIHEITRLKVIRDREQRGRSASF